MVNKEVLAALAREVNRPLGFEDRTVLRETRQRLLSNVTFARLVSDSARYTNAEVRALYDLGGYRYHVQRIVTNDPATAERARADLAAKRLTWAEAVKQYSSGRGEPGPDGDMGWVAAHRVRAGATRMDRLRRCPTGRSRRCSATGGGWQFVRIVERRAEKQPALENIGKALAQEVLSVKLAQRTEQVRDADPPPHRHGLRQHEHRLGGEPVRRDRAPDPGRGRTRRSST